MSFLQHIYAALPHQWQNVTPISPPTRASGEQTTRLDANRHALNSVTIFKSSEAQAVRTFPDVVLKNGDNIVEIFNISSQLDHESPRIRFHTTSTGCASIVSVSASVRNHSGPDDPHIQQLQSSLADARGERQVRQAEYDLLDDVARMEAAGPSPAERSPMSVMNTFAWRKRDAMKATLKLDEKIKELECKLDSALDARKGEATAVVTVVIFTEQDCVVDFDMTYVVGGVSWEPCYDLHARTIDGQLSRDVTLLFGARVIQETGEHWSNTRITLSSDDGHTHSSLSIPTLDPLVPLLHDHDVARGTPVTLDPVTRRNSSGTSHCGGLPEDCHHSESQGSQFHLLAERGSSEEQDASSTVDVVSDFGDTDSVGPNNSSTSKLNSQLPSDSAVPPSATSRGPHPIEFADQVDLDSQRFSATDYEVPHKMSLPSDGVARRVTVASFSLAADIARVCVPRESPSAFLEATIMNNSGLGLPGGHMRVYVDDRLRTKTSIEHVGTTERFTCVLGVDPFLRVAFEESSRAEGATVLYTAATTLKSHHTSVIKDVIVRDLVPAQTRDPHGARDEAGYPTDAPTGLLTVLQAHGEPQREGVRIVGRWPNVKPDRKGRRADGVFEWMCEVPEGETARIETKWVVKPPSREAAY